MPPIAGVRTNRRGRQDFVGVVEFVVVFILDTFCQEHVFDSQGTGVPGVSVSQMEEKPSVNAVFPVRAAGNFVELFVGEQFVFENFVTR